MADLQSAERLMEELRVASYERGCAELEETREFARAAGASEELMNWDVTFWSERMKEAKFEVSDEVLRPYFALPTVLDGLFAVRCCCPCACALYSCRFSSTCEGSHSCSPAARCPQFSVPSDAKCSQQRVHSSWRRLGHTAAV
jgi:Zn-dependent oligopeptidase